jgi:hypothetical protein
MQCQERREEQEETRSRNAGKPVFKKASGKCDPKRKAQRDRGCRPVRETIDKRRLPIEKILKSIHSPVGYFFDRPMQFIGG